MKLILDIAFCFIISFPIYAQQQFTISGYVKDKNTGEVLIGATIYDNNLYKGTVTNSYGFYSLTISEGKHKLICSYMGYKNESIEIRLVKNMNKDFFLENSTINLEAITITTEYAANPLKINVFNTEKLTMKNICKLPLILGEADVIKAIQLQSGVKTLGDGSSGLFVRGGSSDQNLILIDEAPIYNPSHLFGLISVFNPDALKHVDFYKSNMPAQYGGRVSSVIDCKMKEGNLYDYDFSASISLFSARLTANGTIIKGKSSFFVSGRKSFVDFLFSPGPSMTLVPAFYDLNLKVNTIIGKNSRLFVSFYNGKDRIEALDGFYNKWGNSSGTIRWNRNIGNKIFLNTSFIVSNYQNYLEFKDRGRNYRWLTGLNDMNLKFELSYYIRPGNVLKTGVGSIYHKFIPGENSDIEQSIARIQAFEHSFYALNDIELFDWFGLNYGMRLSIFQNYGKATWYSYNEDYLPIKTNTNQKGVYKTYIHAEPRVSLNFKFNPTYSLKIAYARNVQYMQVLQNNSLSYSSLEAWFPANPNIKPIVVDVVSAGWFHDLSKKFLLSAELYYKSYQNQIDYVDHADLINNPYIEGQIRNGKAKVYGMEFNIKKQIGRLTGNISYTYSRALRKIDGINKNKEYSAPYDIPHDFKIIANYKLNKYWTFNTTWMYMSGRPVTLPIGFYEYKDFTNNHFASYTVPIYTDKNSSRFPDYHRMDISFNYEPKKNREKVKWTINFGIFNIYARKNPLAYEFDADYSTGEIKVYQYTLFTILPNFAIKVEF